MAKTEPIREIQQIREIKECYIRKGQTRNYVLIVVGIYTALRISDILSLKWSNVYNFTAQTFYNHLYIVERKTKKTKIIALNEHVIEALKLYLSTLSHCSAETPLFPNNRKKQNPISRVQAYRIIRSVAIELGIEGCISCHSLRKVIGYHSWKKGVPLPLISALYNHASEDVTKRYLGINQDEINQVYLEQCYE